MCSKQNSWLVPSCAWLEILHYKKIINFLAGWRQEGPKRFRPAPEQPVDKGGQRFQCQWLVGRGRDAAGSQDEDEERRPRDHHLLRPELVRQNEAGILWRQEVVREAAESDDGGSLRWLKLIYSFWFVHFFFLLLLLNFFQLNVAIPDISPKRPILTWPRPDLT